MILIVCNICQKRLPKYDQTKGVHFCEKCEPFGKEYTDGIAVIYTQSMSGMERAIEKFRNQLTQKVNARKVA